MRDKLIGIVLGKDADISEALTLIAGLASAGCVVAIQRCATEGAHWLVKELNPSVIPTTPTIFN